MTRKLILMSLLATTACTGNFSTSRCAAAPDGGQNCAVIHQFTGPDLFDPTIVSVTAYHDGKPVGTDMQVTPPPLTSIVGSAVGGGLTAAGFIGGAASLSIPKDVSTTVKISQ